MAGNTSLTREYNRIFSIVQDRLTSDMIFDNVSTRTALLFAMKLKGMMPKIGGRAHLRFNILKELPNTVGYTDLDPITPERADPVTSAVYEWIKKLRSIFEVTYA